MQVMDYTDECAPGSLEVSRLFYLSIIEESSQERWGFPEEWNRYLMGLINTRVLKPNNQMDHTLPPWQQSVNRGLLIVELLPLFTQCLAWKKEQIRSPYASNLYGGHASLYGNTGTGKCKGHAGFASAGPWLCPLGSPLACPPGVEQQQVGRCRGSQTHSRFIVWIRICHWQKGKGSNSSSGSESWSNKWRASTAGEVILLAKVLGACSRWWLWGKGDWRAQWWWWVNGRV